MSHDALAGRVGTSRQHLIRLEKGLHTPRAAMMDAIARETGVPLDSFNWVDPDADEEDSGVQELAAVLLRVIREQAVKA